MLARFARSAAAALLALPAFAVSADEESACTEPGLTLLTDATGDVSFEFLPSGLPVDALDLQALQVSQPEQDDGVARAVFTLKTGSLAQLAPRQAWFVTFKSADKRVHGVRMVVGEDNVVVFQSYLVLIDTDGNVTEGRYPETGSVKPASDLSSYDAGGTIRIVVDMADIGFRKPEGALSDFNAGSLQQIPTGDTLTPSGDLLALIADGMPDDMSRSGEFVVAEAGCAAGSKATQQFGGAFGLGLLLPLLGLAGLRRKA